MILDLLYVKKSPQIPSRQPNVSILMTNSYSLNHYFTPIRTKLLSGLIDLFPRILCLDRPIPMSFSYMI